MLPPSPTCTTGAGVVWSLESPRPMSTPISNIPPRSAIPITAASGETSAGRPCCCWGWRGGLGGRRRDRHAWIAAAGAAGKAVTLIGRHRGAAVGALAPAAGGGAAGADGWSAGAIRGIQQTRDRVVPLGGSDGSLSRSMAVIKDAGERANLPPFTDEHTQLRETIGRWVREEIAPHVDEWEARARIPARALRARRRARLPRAQVPGGARRPGRRLRPRRGLGGGAGGRGRLGRGRRRPRRPHRDRHPARVQVRKPPSSTSAILRPAIAGRKIAALGITEPGAGSDVASIRTEARKVDGGYVVNGSKTFITNGVRADFLVCAVKTTPEGGHQGISFLILERDMPGYEVTRKLEKMGWHSSDTGELIVHRRRGSGREPAGRGEPRLLSDHGELRLGAAADGARGVRRDAAPAGDRARVRGRAGGVRPPDRQASRRSATRSRRSASRRRSGGRSRTTRCAATPLARR